MKISRLITRIETARDKIKYIFQRGIRGYSDKDVWDIDCWFMEIFPKMLQQFRKTSYGHPATLTSNEWKKTLDKMTYLLLETNSFDENSKISQTCRMIQLRLTDPIHKKYENKEITCYEYREIQKNRFMKLFTKHFFDLWD